MIPEKKASIITRVRPPRYSYGKERTEEEREEGKHFVTREVGYTHLQAKNIVFGLMIDDHIGYMSYNIDKEFVEFVVNAGLHFDAGTTMPEIYASPLEMRKAMEELGLFPWKEPDSNA